MKALEGKKLLFLGGFPMLKEAVEWAQSQGAYVIVADYYEDSPCKKVADEAWNISTIDMDALSESCKAAGVNGVFSGFDDFNVINAAKLSDILRIPFYATLEQTLNTMNKANFKKMCFENDVPGTPEFTYEEVKAGNVEFPLIVKPVDSSGNRGIHICRTSEEFDSAVNYAETTSRSSNILIEKYIEGDEVGVNYVLQDGNIALSVMHDRYLQTQSSTEVKLPLAYVYPSKYTRAYVDNENDKVINMFKQAGLENGSLFMQGCVQDGTVYFYEMGYRLNGAKQYQILDASCGYNTMHAMIEYILLGSMSDDDLAKIADPFLKGKCYCTLSLLSKTGKIAGVVGLDQINAMPQTVKITQWIYSGDTLPAEAQGTQKQIAARVTLVADNYGELSDAIDEVNSIFDVLDEDGNSMILDKFDTSRLKGNADS